MLCGEQTESRQDGGGRPVQRLLCRQVRDDGSLAYSGGSR